MEWKAEVRITGVLGVTEDDSEAMLRIIHGVVAHDGLNELTLAWRFTLGSEDINDAIAHASHQWHTALKRSRLVQLSGITPQCVDFRVQQSLLTEEEAERLVGKIFKTYRKEKE